MKVVTEGPLVTDVGKDIPSGKANGESIGMMLFRGIGLTTMKSYLLDMVRVEEDLQLFYLEALRRMMRDGHPVHYSECSSEDWAEIDFHPDLKAMRQQALRDLPS
jgi:choline kinase